MRGRANSNVSKNDNGHNYVPHPSFPLSTRRGSFDRSCVRSSFTGCATGPTIAVHPDPQANYANYHTFAIERSNPPSNPEVTPELVRQVNEAVTNAFVQQGLRPVEQGAADLLILVHGGIQERLDVTDWGFNYGRFHRWGYTGFGGGPYQLQQYREGTLLIDVFDAHTRDLVWRGSAVNQIYGPPNIDRIRAAVTQIVSKFPAQRGNVAFVSRLGNLGSNQ